MSIINDFKNEFRFSAHGCLSQKSQPGLNKYDVTE